MHEIVAVILSMGIISFYSKRQRPTGKVKYRYKVTKHNILLPYLPTKVTEEI